MRYFRFKLIFSFIICLICYNAYSQGVSIHSGQQFYDLAVERGISEKDAKIYVKEGLFRIDVSSNKVVTRCIDYKIDESQDYSIKATLSMLNSAAPADKICGIVFGAKDNENFWVFLVSKPYGATFNDTSSRFKIRKVVNDTTVYDTGWIPLTNLSYLYRMKIWKKNQKLLFYVNDNLVKTIDAPTLGGSKHGFWAQWGRYGLIDFYIKEFESEFESGSSNSASTSESSKTNANSIEPKIIGSGTGFVIDSRGYLVTNYHVTSEAKALYVCLQKNGEWNTYYAKVIINDPKNDLSIIKIDDPSFSEFSNLPYALSFEAEDIASDIFTLGYPQVLVMGTDVKYTTGVINALTGVQGDPTHYQISAHIDHGSSGGPLFNSDGFIIGITDSGLDKATYGDVNYAIKSTYLKALVDVLPIKLNLPNEKSISQKKRTEQVKDLFPYVALILIAQ